MQDSVPPLVTVPTASGPPPCRFRAAPTRSFSMAEIDGNAVGSRPLRPHAVAAAAVATSCSSSLPDSK